MMASGLSKKGGGCYARLPTFDYLFILLFVYVSDHAITRLLHAQSKLLIHPLDFHLIWSHLSC